MSGQLRVSVDREVCCGSGNCVRIAPEVFDQSDDDGLVMLREPEPGAEHESAVYEAVDTCPSAAISATEL